MRWSGCLDPALSVFPGSTLLLPGLSAEAATRNAGVSGSQTFLGSIRVRDKACQCRLALIQDRTSGDSPGFRGRSCPLLISTEEQTEGEEPARGQGVSTGARTGPPAHSDTRRGGLNAQCTWIPSGAGLGVGGKNRLRVATSRFQPGLPEQERDTSTVHLLSKPPWAIRRGPPVPPRPPPRPDWGL